MESTITVFDVFALVASIASIVLAIVSIVLSIVFYRWSAKSSQEITKQAQAIDSNTKKIETLFDKLYSGTFDMMKSSHQAMQNKLYGTDFFSGNSESSDEENIQECIKSVVLKSGEIRKSAMCYIVQRVNPNKQYEESTIHSSIDSLVQNGVIKEQRNMLSISQHTGPSIQSQGSKEEA